jgi:RNA polymerase sigma-70 factor (ECF subfamily)
MEQLDDKILYQKLRSGDEMAFEVLFRRYYSSLCFFARQFLNDVELAEETVQEMFVKIWEKRDQLHIESSVKHYFFRSVRNQCLNHIQHQKIRQQYAQNVMENSQEDINPEKYFMEVGLRKKIEDCIDALPAKRQEIFRLSREQGLKYKEIAETLNISVKTVEAQMGLALKFLRDELKEYSTHLFSLLMIIKK